VIIVIVLAAVVLVGAVIVRLVLNARARRRALESSVGYQLNQLAIAINGVMVAYGRALVPVIEQWNKSVNEIVASLGDALADETSIALRLDDTDGQTP
jgi:hypothetical protein